MKKYKIHVCSRETNVNCERTLVTPRTGKPVQPLLKYSKNQITP